MDQNADKGSGRCQFPGCSGFDELDGRDIRVVTDARDDQPYMERWVLDHADGSPAPAAGLLSDPDGQDSLMEDAIRLAVLRASAAAGSPLALFALAEMLCGESSPQEDMEESARLAGQAADAGYAPARDLVFRHRIATARTPEEVDGLCELLKGGVRLGSAQCAATWAGLVEERMLPADGAEVTAMAKLLLQSAATGRWPYLACAAQLLESCWTDREHPASRACLRLLEAYAARDWVPAKALLGRLLVRGRIAEADPERGRALLEEAWKKGDLEAGCDLAAEMMPSPSGGSGDGAVCMGLLEDLVRQGSVRALCLLGDVYLTCMEDRAAAMESARPLYARAVEAGRADLVVESCLPLCLRDPKDPQEAPVHAQALDLIRQAAGRECHSAKLALARLRLWGLDGAAPDVREGTSLLIEAAASGRPEAMGEVASVLCMGLFGVPSDRSKGLAYALAGWRFFNPRCGALINLFEENGDEADVLERERRLSDMDEPLYGLCAALGRPDDDAVASVLGSKPLRVGMLMGLYWMEAAGSLDMGMLCTIAKTFALLADEEDGALTAAQFAQTLSIDIPADCRAAAAWCMEAVAHPPLALARGILPDYIRLPRHRD